MLLPRKICISLMVSDEGGGGVTTCAITAPLVVNNTRTRNKNLEIMMELNSNSLVPLQFLLFIGKRNHKN